MPSDNQNIFLINGGEMGRKIADADWSATTLGDRKLWSGTLLSALNICLNTGFAMSIFWGKEYNILFNDFYIPILGAKKDWALGSPGKEVWPEAWPMLQEEFSFVQQNAKSIRKPDTKLMLNRNGYDEETFFDYTLSPIIAPNGEVVGILNTAIETTHKVNAKERDAELIRVNLELTKSLETMATLNEELAAANEEQLAINEQFSKMNQQLSDSQDEVQLAIEAAHLATWDLNPDTGRFSGNDLIKEWFGLSPDEEIPLSTATDLIADEDRERVIREINHAMQAGSGGNYDTYYTIVNPMLPVPRIVRAKGKALFNTEGRCIRMSGVLQDVTELKQDEVRKNDFIAMVSHELKTPLTSMNGFLQIIMGRAEKKEDTFTMNMIGKSTKQISKMITLINGFLNVSRLESGKIHIEHNHFDMAILIKEAEEESVASITSHKVVFAPVEETWLMADRDKIGHVINNLISNAVKYSPGGSTINVACITKDSRAYVTVKDQGMGISKEDIPRLFDRYYRVQHANNTTISGFGIGLYLCCEIIKRHDGRLWVDSELGKGSTFHFSLPVAIEKL